MLTVKKQLLYDLNSAKDDSKVILIRRNLKTKEIFSGDNDCSLEQLISIAEASDDNLRLGDNAIIGWQIYEKENN